MKHLPLALLSLFLVGCLHEPQALPRDGRLGAEKVAAPPPTAQQIASCKSTKSWHNAWILTSAILGGAGGATGSAAAITSNVDVQHGVAIAAVSAGLIAVLATAEAGITADDYSSANCVQILQEAAGATP